MANRCARKEPVNSGGPGPLKEVNDFDDDSLQDFI
jgi:hypothetical protein